MYPVWMVACLVLTVCVDHFGPSQGVHGLPVDPSNTNPDDMMDQAGSSRHRSTEFSHCDVNKKQYPLLESGACPKGSDWNIDIACCVGCNYCGAGMRRNGPKCHSPCLQCEEGTYSNASNINNLECAPCTPCEEYNRVYNYHCTLKLDAQCGECIQGFYYSAPAPIDILPGTRPDPGSGTVLGCKKCEPGDTALSCTVHHIDQNLKNLSHKGSSENHSVSAAVALSVVALLAVAAVILFLIFHWRRKRRTRRSKSPVKYASGQKDNFNNEDREIFYEPKKCDAQTSMTRTWETPSEEGGTEVATSAAQIPPPSSKLDVTQEIPGVIPIKSILKNSKENGSTDSSPGEYQSNIADQFYSFQRSYSSLPESVTDATEYQPSDVKPEEEFKSLRPSY